MTDARDIAVENALLRGTLFLTASALREYHGALHTETEAGLQLTVPPAIWEKAGEALARADGMLKAPESGIGR